MKMYNFDNFKKKVNSRSISNSNLNQHPFQEINGNIPNKIRNKRSKKKRILRNNATKIYNFEQNSNKKIQSQKKQIQETIPYVLSKADLLKIKKFQSRETKSNIKDSHSRQRPRPVSKSQSIYSGKNIPIIESELEFQQIGINNGNARNSQIVVLKQAPSHNQSFISVHPNIYGKSHQIIQGPNGESYLLPVNSSIQRVKNKRRLSNGTASHYSKERRSQEYNSSIKRVVQQNGSLSNFALFGSSQNFDQSQVQIPKSYNRNSHQTRLTNDNLRSDILLSRTTSIKGFEKPQSIEVNTKNSTSDFWYYNQRNSNPKGINQKNKNLNLQGSQNFVQSSQYLNNVRQSVNFQDNDKPEFLIYSHNPSLKIQTNSKKNEGYNTMKRSNFNQNLSGKSGSKMKKKKD